MLCHQSIMYRLSVYHGTCLAAGLLTSVSCKTSFKALTVMHELSVQHLAYLVNIEGTCHMFESTHSTCLATCMSIWCSIDSQHTAETAATLSMHTECGTLGLQTSKPAVMACSLRQEELEAFATQPDNQA